MKRLTGLVAVVAMACSGSLWAAEPAGEKGEGVIISGGGPIVVLGGEGGVIGAGGWGRGQNDAAAYIQHMDKIVSFTEEQKKAVGDIFAARAKAVEEFQTQNADKLKAATKAMNEAVKSQDQAGMTKAQEDLQQLNLPAQQIWAKSSESLNKLLTREQQAKLQDSHADAYIKMSSGGAKLTADQMKQLKAAFAEGDGNNYQALSKVLEEILTPEQRTAIAKDRAVNFVKSNYYGAKLTETQLKQVETLSDKLSKDQDLQPQELYQKLIDATNALLNDEQKAAMKASVGGGGWQLGGGEKGAAPAQGGRR